MTILGYVQKVTKCDRIEGLGFALEDWLAKKRQHEECSNRDGTHCRIQDDSLIAAMYKIMPKVLEETTTRSNPSLTNLYPLRHSWRWDDKPTRAEVKKDPHSIEVKGKSVHTSRD